MGEWVLWVMLGVVVLPSVWLLRRNLRLDRLRWDSEGVQRALDMRARGELTRADMQAIWEGRRGLP